MKRSLENYLSNLVAKEEDTSFAGVYVLEHEMSEIRSYFNYNEAIQGFKNYIENDLIKDISYYYNKELYKNSINEIYYSIIRVADSEELYDSVITFCYEDFCKWYENKEGL